MVCGCVCLLSSVLECVVCVVCGGRRVGGMYGVCAVGSVG